MQETVSQKSNVVSMEKRKQEKISLIELIKRDKELRDFFRLVHEEDMREKALALLDAKINQAHTN